MFSYNVPCADGTDRHCSKAVTIRLAVDLDEYELQELLDGNSVFLPVEDLDGIDLGDGPHEYNEDRSMILVGPSDIGLDNVDTICSACGSDQVYDSDMNNITGL